MRSVPEWVGATDNTPPPKRVRMRIFERYNGICQCGCGTKIRPLFTPWDVDHLIAIANGGANRESNLVPMFHEHHLAKTRQDMATKAKGARIRAKHLGLKKPTRSFATNKDQPFKKRIDGTVERRRTPGRHGHIAVKRDAGVAPAAASPWRSLKLETERLTVERMLWPMRDHLAALNDRHHMRYSEQRRYDHTEQSQEEAIAASVKSEHTQYPRLLFYIYVKQTAAGQQLHGLAGSLSVDLDIPNKRADLGVLVLPRWERKGVALEAWKAMVQHLVEKEGIRKLEAGFPATHVAMQNICINSGWVYEGRRESHFDLGDGARDAVVFYGASL